MIFPKIIRITKDFNNQRQEYSKQELEHQDASSMHEKTCFSSLQFHSFKVCFSGAIHIIWVGRGGGGERGRGRYQNLKE